MGHTIDFPSPCSKLLHIFLWSDCDDDISLFLASFYIPVSLHNLFQRLAPVNDRFDRSGLYELF